jgi:type II secretory pathway pseudopilin PulG
MRRFFLRGMSLIEVVVGIALLLSIFMALFGLLRASLQLSALAKAKAVAVELASTQMEYLRGLSYASLGTVGGTPSGSIPQTSTVTVNGVGYPVNTYIVYYDDPKDGTGAGDTNGIRTDYKKAKVTVTYYANGRPDTVALVSTFAPPGVETP